MADICPICDKPVDKKGKGRCDCDFGNGDDRVDSLRS